MSNIRKKNVTLSVDERTYTNFKVECIKNNTTFSEKIEKFMQGFAENKKINDFLTFEESTNPKLDMALEEMHEFIANLTPHRAQELLYKVQEWQTGLMKK